MNKKNIITYMGFFLLFLLFFITEKNMGMRPFALAFFMALIFCRQNVLMLCVLFAASSMLITPELINLIFAFVPCVVVLVAYFIHFKLKKNISLLLISIYAFLCQIPLIILYTADVYQLTNTVISILGTQVFIYCSVTFLNPVLTRGLKYKLRHEELLAFAVIAIVVTMGLCYLQPFGFMLVYPIAVFVVILCKHTYYKLTILVATVLGIGGAFALSSFYFLSMITGVALVVMAFKENNIYITIAGSIVGIFVMNYMLGKGLDPIGLIPFLAGAVLASFLPQSLFRSIRDIGGGEMHNLATRALLNRDRAEVAKRLYGLSQVFYEIQDILRFDLDDKRQRYDEKVMTKEVCTKCCSACSYEDACKEKMGEPAFAVSGLVLAAMDNGRATLLDTPPVLTSGCKRMNALINCTNDIVSRYKKRQQIEDSIEQGREMIIAQMGGVGMLLENLGTDMKTNISYDTLLEKRLYEELCSIDIIASDIIAYGKDRVVDKITLAVKEIDASKKEISEIISQFMGKKMIESHRENNIKGNLTLNYIVAPSYDVVYGEMEISKQGNCGDNRRAVRISEDKLMLILSDGMGSGLKAFNSSMNAINMIESFYKAGFDHNTVLSCVGRLLGLREEEDFNALDIVVVDIRKGTADFIKQGGRESFVLSNGAVEIIHCGSLPLGIVEEISPILEQKQLYDGDIIVLASDGVVDSLGVDMIRDILLTSNTINPQIFAELLVNNAERMSKENNIKDDMSCIVGRILKNNMSTL